MRNTIKEKIKALGGTLFSIIIGGIIILGLFLIPALFIYGGVKISSIVTPWLFLLSEITLAVTILFLLPLSIFSKTRGFAGSGMVIASFVFGLNLWVWGFILTYVLWGWFALFVGLFMLGIGVVPIAMLATMFKGMWPTFWQLVILTTLTFGVRWFGLFLGEKAEERKYKADIDYSNIEMYDEKYNEEYDDSWDDDN